MPVSKRLRYEVLRRDNHASTSVLPPWRPNAPRDRSDRPLRIEPVRDGAERWRPVVGHEGLYEVSDRGAVRSVLRKIIDTRGVARTFRSCLLRPTHEGNPGYAVVSLYRDRGRTTVRVHVLVAAAFLGPRPTGQEVAHGDGDPTHNCLRNLRYATPSGNQRDREPHGTSNRGERNASAVLSSAAVLGIDGHLRAGRKQCDVAAEFGVRRTTVSAIATGRSWAHVTGRCTSAT